MKTAILVNYSANNHSGKKKWMHIQDKVLKILPKNPIIIPYETPFDTDYWIDQLIRKEGIEFFISAGGDGSVNLKLNALMNIAGGNAKNYCLGAIGLGSSNDFLKPFHHHIDGIPVNILTGIKYLSDVGKVTFINEKNDKISRYFIINASVGITACANLLFNQGDFFIRHMKNRFVGITILYAALKTLLRYKNKLFVVKDKNGTHPVNNTNISLTKSPYISGSFHYNLVPDRDSGQLGFHCSRDISKMEIIKTLFDLSQGKFPESCKRSTSFVDHLAVDSEEYLALETDGEVQLSKNSVFTTVPKALYLAS